MKNLKKRYNARYKALLADGSKNLALAVRREYKEIKALVKFGNSIEDSFLILGDYNRILLYKD